MPRGTPSIDRTGQRYSRLTVIKRVENARCGNARWLCACTCGKTVTVTGSDLSRQRTKSCGCLAAERTWRHNRRGLGSQPRTNVDYREMEETL